MAMTSGLKDTELLIPKNESSATPELSIVIPALNEQTTIGKFVEWCNEGIKKAGVNAEILIVNSSTDNTAEIALAGGARVLQVPRRGLGRAYIDAMPYIRGKYVLMGDCDCTYDFRELTEFLREFRAGAEYIMGSRFKGYIEPGAMPPLHQYFGTPITTWILNRIYKSRFSDIHCGMRGITKDAFERIRLQSQGWEYASELVIKAVHFDLKTAEVPIRFYKDMKGRESHHKREGWFSPWKAGWTNLKAMFIYGPNFFLKQPGRVIFFVGLLLTLLLAKGPITVGAVTFSLNWMLIGVVLAVLGLQCVYMGILAEVVLDFRSTRTPHWLARFRYSRTVLASVVMFILGAALNIPLVLLYRRQEFLLFGPAAENHWSILGLLFMIMAFMTFTFTLVLHATAVGSRKDPQA